MSDYAAGVSDQRGQQLVFGWRKVGHFPGAKDLPPHQIDFEIAGLEAGFAITSRCKAGVSEGHSNSRQQFGNPKRFGQIVIGAEVERIHLVALLPPGRDHDDRCAGRTAELPGYLETVPVGQAEVEQDDLRVAAGSLGQSLACRRGLDHLILVGPRVAPRKRRIWGSSSINSTNGFAVVNLVLNYFCRHAGGARVRRAGC